MTFEEARAQFPVLERLVYIQAGSVGPLARGTLDAMIAEEERSLRDGRGSLARFERVIAEREELRIELGALVGVDASRVSTTWLPPVDFTCSSTRTASASRPDHT